MRHGQPMKKVLIIGGGFGGLYTAMTLRGADVAVTLVDRTNHHLFQPLLYQVATAALSPADIAMPIREILRKHRNVRVMMGDVVSIEPRENLVKLKSGKAIAYDYLVVAVGTRHDYFGHDEWEERAPGLKTLDDALRIRDRILMSFEWAEAAGTQQEAGRYLRFAVVGGGPTGVEISGAIAEISKKTMKRDFRLIDPTSTRIFLLEGAGRILPEFPESLARRAERDLTELGVEIMTGCTVTDINEHGVIAEGKCIEAKNIIWAAGNKASPLLQTLGAPMDRIGRVKVGPDLSVPGHPNVFVIGDAAYVIGPNGKPVPGLAPAAIQEARHAAGIIKADIPPEKRNAFKYRDKGTLATVGIGRSVAKVGKLEFGGTLAWVFWSAIHLMYIILHRNRLLVALGWLYSYLTGRRGARLIQTAPRDRQE